jgi:hypothetical protein
MHWERRQLAGKATRNELDLPLITNEEAMAVHFAAYLQHAYADRHLSVRDCTVDKITYRPQESSVDLLYRLGLQEGAGAVFEQWFFVRFYADDPAEKYSQWGTEPQRHPVTGWRPIDSWPAHSAVIWAFPHDERLPQLAQAADCADVAAVATAAAVTLGFTPGTICHQVRRHLVKYMPGKRCVLRFTLTMTDPVRGACELELYSKTYGDGTSGAIYAAFHQLSTQSAFAVPETVLHLPAIDTYWQKAWPGVSLEEHYDPDAYAAILPQVVGALVAFHRSTLAPLAAAPDGAAEAAEARRNGKKIGHFLPQRQATWRALGDRIAEAFTLLPPLTAPLVPLHGTFRLSQLLSNGRALAVTDLDAIGLGDPHYDVAEFMATVRYQRFRRQRPAHELIAQAAAFQRHYQQQVPWPLEQQRLHWYIAASLLRKFRQSLKGLEVPILGQQEELSQLIEAELALACHPVVAAVGT